MTMTVAIHPQNTRTGVLKSEKKGWDGNKEEEEDKKRRRGSRGTEAETQFCFLPTALRRVIMSGLPARLARTKIHHIQKKASYAHTHTNTHFRQSNMYKGDVKHTHT